MLELVYKWLLTQIPALTSRDMIIIIGSFVIIWGVSFFRGQDKRLKVLEKHKKKTETIITALPFMSVGTGVWYTDDSRNGKYVPVFECLWVRATKENKNEPERQTSIRRYSEGDAPDRSQSPT